MPCYNCKNFRGKGRSIESQNVETIHQNAIRQVFETFYDLTKKIRSSKIFKNIENSFDDVAIATEELSLHQNDKNH
jgi:hypothetical protein